VCSEFFFLIVYCINWLGYFLLLAAFIILQIISPAKTPPPITAVQVIQGCQLFC